MNTKFYPKTIVLRKSLMGVTILVMAAIVSLILYNLSRTNYVKERTIKNEIHSVANESDTRWYKEKTSQPKEIVSNQEEKDQLVLSKKIVAHSENNQALDFSSSSPIHEEDIQKAMSAPITSNQLTAGSTDNISGTINGANAYSGASSNAEFNSQSEKKAFLQTAKSNDDYLENTLQDPISPYEIQAGTIIPGLLITGVNSDLPGQLTGQVRSNVYDSIKGQYLLIPQGAKLVGLYDSQVVYGQRRLLIVWNRIIFPNGQSLNLNGMPGVDMRGYAGFSDQVNNHYSKIFGSVLMMSVLSAGAQLSQPQNSNNTFAAPTVGQTLAQSLGTNISNTATALASKDLSIQPTLEIRPGYLFNISITKDMVFPGTYAGEVE